MTTNPGSDASLATAPRRGGPRTTEGVERCKLNACSHGLRAAEPVVPGENPADWETHRAAIVSDLDPVGAIEIALAEQVASKLWRLGRVVRYESDLIANAQDPDELAHAHEHTYRRMCTGLGRADIPTRDDVDKARRTRDRAAKALQDRDELLALLTTLPAMGDEDTFPEWSPLYDGLKKDLRFDDDDLDELFEDEDGDGPFLARHARKMFAERGSVDEVSASVEAHWHSEREKEEDALREATRNAKSIARRYTAALRRRSRAQGLPAAADLDRIQRYEAHLERGVHRDLDRLRSLQEARGLGPPPSPTVAVSIHTGQPPEAGSSPFGRFAIEASGGAEDGASTEPSACHNL